MEGRIDALFPGKQGFFAYFLHYADSAGFAQFVLPMADEVLAAASCHP